MNIIVISLIAFGGRFFKILPLIRSISGTLLFFVLSIIFLISCAVVLGMVYSLLVVIIVACASSSVGFSRLLLLIMCGVSVLQRWLENSSACSLLLLAHVLSAFLIVGRSIIGFFIFFKAFHRE